MLSLQYHNKSVEHMYHETHPDIVEKVKCCCAKTKKKCIDTLAKIEDLRTKVNDICSALYQAVSMAE